jgi:hypothetical protein
MTQQNATDGYVQHAPDSTGKKVDTSEVTRDDGTVVERQKAIISDPAVLGDAGQAGVRDGRFQVEDRMLQVLDEINDNLEHIRFMLETMSPN